MKKFATFFAILLMFQFARAEQFTQKVELVFALSESVVDVELDSNKIALSRLDSLLEYIQANELSYIDKIVIESYASPEGQKRLNERLTAKRSQAVVDYLNNNFELSKYNVELLNHGVAWAKLREMVAESQTPHRDEVLRIIDTTPEETWSRVNPSDRYLTLVDSRNKRLMDLRGGVPYKYMAKHIFPILRSSSIVTIYVRKESPVIDDSERYAKIPISAPAQMSLPKLSAPKIFDTPKISTDEYYYVSKPLLAVKTNLLFNALLMPNIEVEVPIKERWSVSVDWMFPWWVTRNNGNALQVLSGNIEGRYWLGDRTDRKVLTGWFAGLYFGGGYYDLQYKNNGYQGEFFIAAGVSGGYAHTINRRGNLRMEYTLGVGYLKTDYRYYEGREQNEFLVWQYDGNYTWIGPTRAKVSLVWMWNKNRRYKR